MAELRPDMAILGWSDWFDRFDRIDMVIWAIVFVGVVIYLIWVNLPKLMSGGALSPNAGPVDMLLEPKELIMDGYRFQDTLFPPVADDGQMRTDQNPNERARVGEFKSVKSVESTGSNIVEGYADGVTGTMSQLVARDQQDVNLTGPRHQPIADNVNMFGRWAIYRAPEAQREVNWPNAVFSWGDIINRYHGKIRI
jgi:hypothetical protein